MQARVYVCVCLYVSGGVCEGRLSSRRKWSQRKPVHRDLTISKLWDSRILCHQTVTHNEKSHTTSRVYELVSPLAFFFFFLPYWKLSLTFRVKTPYSFPIIKILTLEERTTGLHVSPRKFLTAAWPGCYYEWRDMGQRQKGRLKLTAPSLATEPSLWSSKEKEPSACIFCILQAPKLLGFSSSSFL